ncbi:MAG: SDR family oxidoreductase [Treponema sp.]|jgi:sorbitol-6-phosphate 2-dehydrogenase|nr:SDR family oxidoreductase [Treponema sp.]
MEWDKASDQTDIHAVFAPIIRGLCINTAGYPWVVMYDSGLEKIPPAALTVDIRSALTEAGTLNEESAAKVFREAYIAWEFDIAPAGVDALVQPKPFKQEPSCVVLKSGDTVKAGYWIDRNLDSAKHRMAKKDDSLLKEALPKDLSMNSSWISEFDTAQRVAVVRNKAVLVTGGIKKEEKNIGTELVQSLARSGALVFIADSDLKKMQQLAEQINKVENRTAVIALPVNGADEASVKDLFKTIAETAGGLDICISNGEFLNATSVLEQSLDDFHAVTDVNYIGFFLMLKYGGLLFRRQHRTAPHWKTDIIQINSKFGLIGSQNFGANVGSKFGGLGLISSAAMELVEYNIKVNAICPGNFFDHTLGTDPKQDLFVRYFKSGTVPMKRACTGDDVARAMYYLIEQEYETGQAIPVTGGEVMLH